MNTSSIGHNRPASQRLHPFVYKAITGVTEIAWQEKSWRLKPSNGRWLNGALPMRFSRSAS